MTIWSYELEGISLGPQLEDDSDFVNSNDLCRAAQNDEYQSCACRIERTKSYVNLNGIIRNCTYDPSACKVPRFVISGFQKWDYAFQPCHPFGMFQNVSHRHAGDKSCKNAAVTRYTTESAFICDSLGSQSDFIFRVQEPFNQTLVTSNLTLTFQNPKTLSSAVISLVCNSSIPVNESLFTFKGISNAHSPTYYLALESICCCPGGCNVTFPIYDKRNPEPTEGFWVMVGIIAGIVLVMIIAMIFVKYTNSRTASDERRRLLDPMS